MIVLLYRNKQDLKINLKHIKLLLCHKDIKQNDNMKKEHMNSSKDIYYFLCACWVGDSLVKWGYFVTFSLLQKATLGPWSWFICSSTYRVILINKRGSQREKYPGVCLCLNCSEALSLEERGWDGESCTSSWFTTVVSFSVSFYIWKHTNICLNVNNHRDVFLCKCWLNSVLCLWQFGAHINSLFAL